MPTEKNPSEKTPYQFKKTDYQLFDTYFKRNLRIIGEYLHLGEVVGRLYEDKKIYKSRIGLYVFVNKDKSKVDLGLFKIKLPKRISCWVMTRKEAHKQFIEIYEKNQ